nr:unnamed protein product [Spirometra erinaceieuropaei]
MTAKSARDDRKQYWAEIATSMEQASNAGGTRKLARWREHFEHHLNFDTQPTSPLLSSSAEFLPSPTYAVPYDPPSEGEVADAIRKLRNNKAPGVDGIPAEVFKSCVDTLAPWLHEEILEMKWQERIPGAAVLEGTGALGGCTALNQMQVR